MKKYWVYFLQTINEFLTYRFRFFYTAFSQFITPLTMMWVFSALPGNKFAGMTKEEIMIYYLSTSFLALFMNSKADDHVKTSIQQGGLGICLTQPIHFWIISLIQDSSRRIIRLLICLPFFLAILYFSGKGPDIIFSNFSFQMLPIIITSLILTFTFSFTFGLTTFWLGELWGWQNLKEILVILLSGIALPYQFFPEKMVSFLKYTPFPYFTAWTLRAGFTGSIYFEFLVAVVWIIVFCSLGRILWFRGLRIYSGMNLY